jgi:hypothetical protein
MKGKTNKEKKEWHQATKLYFSFTVLVSRSGPH